MNKLNYIAIILIALILTSCTSFKGNTGKIKKEINIEDIKREGLTTVTNTFNEGPNIGFNNAIKPRREMSSSSSEISFPNFPISIKFQNSDLREALIGLGNLVNRNVVVDPSVQGVLNFSVSNEPWNNVINAVIEMNGLVQSSDNNSGIIKISGGGASDQIQMTEIFNIFYEKPSEIKKQLEAVIGGDPVAGGSTVILIDNDNNQTIIAKGSPSDLKSIENILEKIDVKKPQVLIEAFLVEVSPSFSSKLGTRLGLARSKTTASGATESIRGGIGTSAADLALGNGSSSATDFLISGTSGLGILRETSAGDLKFEIDALETEGDSRTLSNPKLFTISGKNAIIKQGTQFGVTETTTAASGTTTSATKYFDANLQLDVTPIITGDGTVMMEVKITNDAVDLSVSPPKITKKEVDTNLILANGDIAVVGGILTETLSETNNRVPGLGKIPVIGALFRSRAQADDRQELLIFLAPRII